MVFRAISVPVALKQAVDMEISRLLQEGVINPVKGADIIVTNSVVYKQKSN